MTLLSISSTFFGRTPKTVFVNFQVLLIASTHRKDFPSRREGPGMMGNDVPRTHGDKPFCRNGAASSFPPRQESHPDNRPPLSLGCLGYSFEAFFPRFFPGTAQKKGPQLGIHRIVGLQGPCSPAGPLGLAALRLLSASSCALSYLTSIVKHFFMCLAVTHTGR